MTDRLFTDIDTHWAKACILALAQKNVISGYPDGRFLPDASLKRAEFAALMQKAFPNAPQVRQPIEFPDVPATYWGYAVVQWGYSRGFFSGSSEGTFQPEQPITRLQVLLVLAAALGLTAPDQPDETLKVYFTDSSTIPQWARGTIAATVQADLVVNYPNVRQLRPNANATRAEVCAFVCRALKLDGVVPVAYCTWSWGIYSLTGEVTVPFDRWKGSGRLMRDIQVLLTNFGLYPGGSLINGEYNWQTEKGLKEFCAFYGLSTMTVGVFDAKFAWTLLNADPIDYLLAQAKDRQKIYNEFLQQEAGFDQSKLAFLDRGIQNSPYRDQVKSYPDRLTQLPNGSTLISLGTQLQLTGSDRVVSFTPYPVRGSRPAIEGGLEFLHSDIQQACVCVGSVVDGKVRTHWSGRNALKAAQLWSATKIIPLINVVCQANAVAATAPVRDCLVRSIGGSGGYGFYNLAVD
ncbi:MAG TPA: S-layer homology domain-containing protein, partial [Allocoleopsis sp.]